MHRSAAHLGGTLFVLGMGLHRATLRRTRGSRFAVEPDRLGLVSQTRTLAALPRMRANTLAVLPAPILYTPADVPDVDDAALQALIARMLADDPGRKWRAPRRRKPSPAVEASAPIAAPAPPEPTAAKDASEPTPAGIAPRRSHQRRPDFLERSCLMCARPAAWDARVCGWCGCRSLLVEVFPSGSLEASAAAEHEPRRARALVP